MELETAQTTCHHCSVCDECDAPSEAANGSLPAGYGLVAISFLLFFAPAALALLGTWAFGHTATLQWLGGAGGFVLGMLAAVLIAGRVTSGHEAKRTTID